MSELTGSHFFCLNALGVFAEMALPDPDKGDPKEAIASYQEKLKTVSADQRSLLKVQLAIAYYRDQEVEKSYQMFLDALQGVIAKAPAPMNEDESKLYGEALQLYLSHAGADAREAAVQIRSHYGPILEQHPEYFRLNYLLAAADANLGAFDQFFRSFFNPISKTLKLIWPIVPRLSCISSFTKRLVHLRRGKSREGR